MASSYEIQNGVSQGEVFIVPSFRLHFASPPQSGLEGQAWVEKFVLNLCYLCFKVPEFVLLPTLCDKLISFFFWGGGG